MCGIGKKTTIRECSAISYYVELDICRPPSHHLSAFSMVFFNFVDTQYSLCSRQISLPLTAQNPTGMQPMTGPSPPTPTSALAVSTTTTSLTPQDASPADAAPTQSTHASRNPHQVVQPPKARVKHSLSDAQKATKALNAQLSKTNANALRDEISAFKQEQEARFLELSKKHSCTVTHIRKLFTGATLYKSTRAPSLRNAIVHRKAMLANQGM